MSQAQQHSKAARGHRIGGWAGPRRRVPLVAGAAIALVVATAAPATAVATMPINRTASAFWVLNDQLDTRVSLSPRANQTTRSLFINVVQQFCDTGTGQKVVRSFSGDTPIRRKSFLMDRRLNSARLSVTTTVRANEQRIAGCVLSNGGATVTELGNVALQVQVRWRGDGPTVDVQPGVRERQAVATGTITGRTLPLGRLGPSTAASLRTMAS